MPICIPKELPAFQTLANENIFVMDNDRASHQDIRPLRVLLLNLMPKKIETECQFLRLLSNTPIQVNVEFLQVSSHVSKNTNKMHLDAFYHTFAEIQNEYYDGCIITGAPVRAPFFCRCRLLGRAGNKSWSGQKPMSFPPCISAGELWQGCTTTSGFPNMTCRKKCSGSFRMKCCKKMCSCCEDLTTAFMLRIPATQKSGVRTLNKYQI